MTHNLTITKALTSRKLRPVVVINGEYVVLNSQGEYHIFDSCSLMLPNSSPFIDPKLFEFDPQPFIDYYIADQQRQQQGLLEKKAAAQLAEKERIEELKTLVRRCETPAMLADMFGFKLVDIAGQWRDLYAGRSVKGLLISSREEYEVVELAIAMFNADGDYGHATYRTGEHHNTFVRGWGGLEGYQEDIRGYFSTSDNYFYNSQENDHDSYMERIREADDIDAVKELIEAYDKLEEGYYDCNGNLVMPSSELNSPDFTGYSEDVYTYNFCYMLYNGNAWQAEPVDEGEED